MDLRHINIQTLQGILDQFYPGAKAYGEPGGDLRAALCGNDIVYVRRGLLNDIVRSHAGLFEHALGEPETLDGLDVYKRQAPAGG